MNDRPPPHSDASVYEHRGSIIHFRQLPSAQYFSFHQDRSPSGRLLPSGSWVSYDHDLYDHDVEAALDYWVSNVSYITFGYSEVHVAVKTDGSERRTAGYPLEKDPRFTCYIDPTVYLADVLRTSRDELQGSFDAGNFGIVDALHQQTGILDWMAAHETDLAVVPSGLPQENGVIDKLRPLGPNDQVAKRSYRRTGWVPVLCDPRDI